MTDEDIDAIVELHAIVQGEDRRRMIITDATYTSRMRLIQAWAAEQRARNKETTP